MKLYLNNTAAKSQCLEWLQMNKKFKHKWNEFKIFNTNIKTVSIFIHIQSQRIQMEHNNHFSP